MSVRGLVLFVSAVLFAASPAFAEDLATEAEAESLFGKAMAHLDSVGEEQAFADFNAGDSAFKDKDLYMFCLNFEGKWLAMGAKPTLVGRVALDLKDKAGKFLVREMIDVAKSETGEGSVEYSWPNPVTNKIGPKYSFIRKVGEDKFCGMGYYK